HRHPRHRPLVRDRLRDRRFRPLRLRRHGLPRPPAPSVPAQNFEPRRLTSLRHAAPTSAFRPHSVGGARSLRRRTPPDPPRRAGPPPTPPTPPRPPSSHDRASRRRRTRDPKPADERPGRIGPPTPHPTPPAVPRSAAAPRRSAP